MAVGLRRLPAMRTCGAEVWAAIPPAFEILFTGRGAEDLTSAIFLHAWRRRAEVQLVDDRLAPWLYGIAANLCRRHRRGARRQRAALARLSVSLPEPDLADDVAH